jgi:hypothetical protein
MGFGKVLLVGAALAGTAFLTYRNHDKFRKAEYMLLHGRQEVAEDFFQDPPGLENYFKVNQEGSIETYNMHKSSGREVEVLRDLMPRTETIIRGLEKRYERGYYEGRSFAVDFVELARKDAKAGMTSEETERLYSEVGDFYRYVKNLRKK